LKNKMDRSVSEGYSFFGDVALLNVCSPRSQSKIQNTGLISIIIFVFTRKRFLFNKTPKSNKRKLLQWLTPWIRKTMRSRSECSSLLVIMAVQLKFLLDKIKNFFFLEIEYSLQWSNPWLNKSQGLIYKKNK